MAGYIHLKGNAQKRIIGNFEGKEITLKNPSLGTRIIFADKILPAFQCCQNIFQLLQTFKAKIYICVLSKMDENEFKDMNPLLQIIKTTQIKPYKKFAKSPSKYVIGAWFKIKGVRKNNSFFQGNDGEYSEKKGRFGEDLQACGAYDKFVGIFKHYCGNFEQFKTNNVDTESVNPR